MNYYQSGISVNPLYSDSQYQGAVSSFNQTPRFNYGQMPSYFQGLGDSASNSLAQALAYQGNSANQQAGTNWQRQYAGMNTNWLNNAEQGRANMGLQNASWANQNQQRLYDQHSQMLGGLMRMFMPMWG